MKILFINPNWEKSHKTLWKRIASVYPPLGMLNIAGVLEQEGHEVRFLDMQAENLIPKDVLDSAVFWDFKKVSELKFGDKISTPAKFDVFGITMTAPLVEPGLEVARLLKQAYPEAKIVIGGVHASIIHQELIKHDFIDFVVREEGELTMKEYCSGKPLKDILGVTWKEMPIMGQVRRGMSLHRPKPEIRINPSRPQLMDIDWLPMIPYHLMKMDLYKPPLGGYKRLPAFMMITSRNCIGNCSFCQHYHRVVRFRSAEKIFEEVQYLNTEYGVREINFYDDTITINKPNIKKLCELLINSKLDIVWSCFTRVNCVDEELLKLMKQAGCHLILFGVESADEGILNAMHKNIKLEQVEKAVALCKKVGIKVRCSYIFGYPGETKETMMKTFEYSKKLNTEFVQYNAITAYPGTELWTIAEANGWLVDTAEHDVSNCNIQAPGITRQEVLDFYKVAHRKYYLRPRIMLMHLFGVRSFEDIKQEFNGLRAMIGGGE